MTAKLPLLSTAALALSACTTAPAPPPEMGAPEGAACDADAGQAFVGQKADAQTGSQLLSATGARQLRWVPPRTAVTMDFRPDRLTVSYDDDMVITQVSCT